MSEDEIAFCSVAKEEGGWWRISHPPTPRSEIKGKDFLLSSVCVICQLHSTAT